MKKLVFGIALLLSAIFFYYLNKEKRKDPSKTTSGTVRLNENSALTEIDTIKLNQNEKILSISDVNYDSENNFWALVEDTLTKNRYVVRFDKSNRYREILIK